MAELETPDVCAYSGCVHLGIIILCGLSVLAGACSRSECEGAPEPVRPLDLAVAADRDHLAADLASAARTAQQYGDRAAEGPADPRYVNVETLRQHARAYCQALLTEHFAAIHRLDLDAVERIAAASDPRPQP